MPIVSIQNMLIASITYQALLFTMTPLIIYPAALCTQRACYTSVCHYCIVTLLLFLTMFFWKTAFPFVFAAVAGYLFSADILYYPVPEKYTLCLR